MTVPIIVCAVVIVACVVCNRISDRLGLPTLLAFILLGMFFGSDGLVRISFDNYSFAEQICSVALIFIMFYGGFGTNAAEAKPVFSKAALLSSFGTAITAALVGAFCFFILKIGLYESMLIGAVISSTDAASVFSILRSKRLNLRGGTASLLEVESGSNDPFSYMLTFAVLSLMHGSMGAGGLASMLALQIILGVLFGIGIAILALEFLKRFSFKTAGFDAIFIVAAALLAYALPTLFGGNGYLSAYITGIILGNSRFSNKQSLVHFFDGVTGLMQMLLFFLLGLLSFPSQLPQIALTALSIALFLTFVARPVAVFAILAPFKSAVNQMTFVSFAGMRGAASIVFAIMTVVDPAVLDNDIFHIIFFIVLFSILIQGSLLAPAAKLLNMTDERADVMKTFTDYRDEVPVQFIRFTVSPTHRWVGRKIREITLPPECILVQLIRGGERHVPNGGTRLEAGDTLILSGKAARDSDTVHLCEKTVTRSDPYINRRISEFPYESKLIIMIRRGNGIIIPKGSTVLREGDILVINE